MRIVLLSIAASGTSLACGQVAQDGKQLITREQAAATFGQGRKWAVLVGVNNYRDSQIPALRYCVSDAQLVHDKLTQCGYEDNHILLLAGERSPAHLQPTTYNLQKQVSARLKDAQPGDTVIVFFSGHGFLDASGHGYLATQDCEMADLGRTAFRTEDLRELLLQCKASTKFLVLDCCHAGSEKDGSAAGSSSQALGESIGSPGGLVTLGSCRKQETSREWDAQKHGLFTWFLAKGLEGEADADKNRVIDFDELYNYVYDNVLLTGQDKLNAVQTPVKIMREEVYGHLALAWLKSANSGNGKTNSGNGKNWVFSEFQIWFGLGMAMLAAIFWRVDVGIVDPLRVVMDRPRKFLKFLWILCTGLALTCFIGYMLFRIIQFSGGTNTKLLITVLLTCLSLVVSLWITFRPRYAFDYYVFEGGTFKDTAIAIATHDDASVDFIGFTEDELAAPLGGDFLRRRTPAEALQSLGLLAKKRGAIPEYGVELTGRIYRLSSRAAHPPRESELRTVAPSVDPSAPTPRSPR